MDFEFIESIADKVKEKPRYTVEISDTEYNKMTPEQLFLSGIDFIDRFVFFARDKANFFEREKFLIEIIEKENSYQTKNIYIEPTIKSIVSNGKEIIKLPKKVKAQTNCKRVKQCKDEIEITRDLIQLYNIAKNYQGIEGKNERINFSLYAKEGQSKEGFRQVEFYSEIEFSDIVSMIFEAIDEGAQPQQNITPIRWTGSTNELMTMFKKMKTEKLIYGRNADIARIICECFTDKNNKSLKFTYVQSFINNPEKYSNNEVDFSQITKKLKTKT